MNHEIVIFVDVDDTFVRSYGEKRIPIPSVIDHIKSIKEDGAILYCWSSGGSEYARLSAIEFGIDDCFEAFLPKPNVAIDDVQISQWRSLIEVHPNECTGESVSSYKEKLYRPRTAT